MCTQVNTNCANSTLAHYFWRLFCKKCGFYCKILSQSRQNDQISVQRKKPMQCCMG